MAAAMLLACAGNVPEPGESHVQWAQAHGQPSSLEELREGRQMLVQKCGGCHSLPRLRRYAPEKWPAIMDSMRVEAKLYPREDSLIRAYLTAASGQLRDSLRLR